VGKKYGQKIEPVQGDSSLANNKAYQELLTLYSYIFPDVKHMENIEEADETYT
jgi:hypothetical protein